MNTLPDIVYKLISKLEKFPGIGPKSAARIAIYLLKRPAAYNEELGSLLKDLQMEIVKCEVCHNIATKSPCLICSDKRRDPSIICVIEDPLDLLSFESSIDYNGLYHVLGGIISPVSGIGPEDLTISSLIERLRGDTVKELIIATNPIIEGEATAMYIMEEMKKNGLDKKIKVSRLARGLPSGADLEYADKVTLKRAFEGRTALD